MPAREAIAFGTLPQNVGLLKTYPTETSMNSTITLHRVLRAFHDELGPHTSETEKVRHFENRPSPVNVERRGCRHVNVWIRPPRDSSRIPAFAKLYPASRTRNWQLSDPLQPGQPVLRLPVSSEEELRQAVLLTRD